MRLRIVDFETTGAQASEVIEAGFVDLVLDTAGWRIHPTRTQLFKPAGEISVHARAVHHIPDAALEDASPSSAEAVEAFLLDGEEPDAFVAHHAEFERSFLPNLAAQPWICTAKSARRAWPHAVGHSNQVLRYWLNLDLDPLLALPAHRAGPDAFVTAHVLKELLQTETVERLLEWTGEPPLVGFGKHKGKPWSDVPSDYLDWMMRERGMSDRHLAGARRELKRRTLDQAA